MATALVSRHVKLLSGVAYTMDAKQTELQSGDEERMKKEGFVYPFRGRRPDTSSDFSPESLEGLAWSIC